MSLHLSQDLTEAHNSLLKLSGSVEDMIASAVRSLVERRGALAAEVIDRDSQIDRSEVRIEEDCLKMLALHQPVAADLRRITTIQYMTICSTYVERYRSVFPLGSAEENSTSQLSRGKRIF